MKAGAAAGWPKIGSTDRGSGARQRTIKPKLQTLLLGKGFEETYLNGQLKTMVFKEEKRMFVCVREREREKKTLL